ncbi:MAG TPA: thiamine-phosphate kinase [Gemmatimonadaceae bacterium]|nr:thiamine-phosphate kinase [Gemmatimonadaceae bacterium]
MSDETSLGPGREFDLVRVMMSRWGDRARGIGDDATVLSVPNGEQLVVSTDASLEDVHFRRDWLSPAEIGWRATAAALSDLAAMAAQPLGMVIALTLSDRWLDDLGELAEGIGESASAVGAPIVGGDLTRGDHLGITITVLGSTAAPLRRGGAQPGDTLWVTGQLGGPALAIAAWSEGRQPTPEARARFARPVPRIREAQWLARAGATAGIDISDGLGGDAGHLAAASGVRIAIDADALPRAPGADVSTAQRSGEEYELLVTTRSRLDPAAFQREFGLSLTRIGTVEQGDAGVDLLIGGERVASPAGYDHFSQ